VLECWFVILLILHEIQLQSLFRLALEHLRHTALLTCASETRQRSRAALLAMEHCEGEVVSSVAVGFEKATVRPAWGSVPSGQPFAVQANCFGFDLEGLDYMHSGSGMEEGQAWVVPADHVVSPLSLRYRGCWQTAFGLGRRWAVNGQSVAVMAGSEDFAC
jgi:hypothetical protein